MQHTCTTRVHTEIDTHFSWFSPTNTETTFTTADRLGRNATSNNRVFGESRLHCFFVCSRHYSSILWSDCCQFIICHRFDQLDDGILRSRRRKQYLLSKHRHTLRQCFWKWVPQRGVKDFERRKGVMATFDTYHFVTLSTQINNRSFIPEASWFCSQVSLKGSPYIRCVMRNYHIIISLRLAADLSHVRYIKDKEMLVFSFIYDLSSIARGASVRSVAFLGSMSQNRLRSTALLDYKMYA